MTANPNGSVPPGSGPPSKVRLPWEKGQAGAQAPSPAGPPAEPRCARRATARVPAPAPTTSSR